VSFPVVFIENEQNLGVAKGNNEGIESALKDGCALVLLSNNDIQLEPDAIESLLAGLVETSADLAVPKIYYSDSKTIWAAGGDIDYRSGTPRHYGIDEVDKGQYQARKAVSYAPSCFMLIRSEVFQSIGLMDENYFVYFDDVDFVYRALTGGKTLFYIPESAIYHNCGHSTGGMSDFSVYHVYRNRIYFALKNLPFARRSFLIIANYFFQFTVRLLRRDRHRWQTELSAMNKAFPLYRSFRQAGKYSA
jgi:GT2 family glycosyltransferase